MIEYLSVVKQNWAAASRPSGTLLDCVIPLSSSSDIILVKVDLSGNETILASGTDYSVELAEGSEDYRHGCVVRLLVFISDALSAYRNTSVDQSVSLALNARMPGPSFERQLDKMVMGIQDAKYVESKIETRVVSIEVEIDTLGATVSSHIGNSTIHVTGTQKSNINSIPSIAASVTSLNTSVVNLQNSLSSINVIVSNHTAAIQSLDTSVYSINQAVVEHTAAIQSLDTSVYSINQAVVEHTAAIQSINVSLSNIDAAVSNHTAAILQNQEAIANKADIFQYSTAPSASSSSIDIFQYTGTTNASYTQGYWYRKNVNTSSVYQVVITNGFDVVYITGEGLPTSPAQVHTYSDIACTVQHSYTIAKIGGVYKAYANGTEHSCTVSILPASLNAVVNTTALFKKYYDALPVSAEDSAVMYEDPNCTLSNSLVTLRLNPNDNSYYVYYTSSSQTLPVTITQETGSQTSYSYVQMNVQPGGGSPSWGGITGTLSNQTDLQAALDAKVSDAFISGSTVSLKGQQGNVVIPMATESSGGVIGRINEQNGLYQSGQWTVLSIPSTAQIDSRTAGRRAITPALLDYAVKAAMTDGVGTAWTDAERLAGTQRMRSTATLAGSTVTIASLLPNCDYVCSDPVEQLTITGSTASNIDTSITFTAGTVCSVSLPADMDDTNFTPPEANKRCYMGVVNGAAFSVIGGTATAGE